jgi:hypothetical protein
VVSDDFGRVAAGGLTNCSFKATVTSLSSGRDEAATPGLDAARFTTLRSIMGRSGVFCTAGRSLANAGSDYQLLQYGQVMDVACFYARDTLLGYLNASIRVDKKTGYILERDAQAIEAQCLGVLNEKIVNIGDASSASVVVNRTTNILSTQTLIVSVRVVPLGYARAITVDIGFQNPATLVSSS